MNEGELCAMLSRATEFEQLKVRDEEMDELDDLTHDSCQVPVAGGSENVHGKVNILIQTHISRYISDLCTMKPNLILPKQAIEIFLKIFQRFH